jgi:hypothetical protein
MAKKVELRFEPTKKKKRPNQHKKRINKRNKVKTFFG